MKKENGITLIALVITIVVLLILAGVTLNIVIGNGGILEKAKQSKENMQVESEKEKISLAYDALMIETIKSGEEITVSKLRTELQAYGDNISVSEDSEKNFIILFNDTNSSYKLDKNGNISENKEKLELYTKTIEFTKGKAISELGFEEYSTDTPTLNALKTSNANHEGFLIGASWANGFAYIESLEKYDFSKIDKIEVGVAYGANLASCVNTFSVGLCSTDDKNKTFEENLEASETRTNLTNNSDIDIVESDINTIELDTSEVSGEYYLKLCEDHGPTPSAYSTYARIFWIKIYYNYYNT